MKTSVALLILGLFHFCVAEVQGLDHRAGKGNSSETPKIKPPCACADVRAGGQENHFQFAIILREVEAKLRNTEKQLEDLRGEVRGNQVAFGASSGISGNFGPFNAEVTLIYKNVYANTGEYNPTTGIFTAPVNGVYYFSFSGHNLSRRPMGLRLMKNGVQIVTVYNHPGGNRHETATNGITIQLQWGDQVYMRLRAHTWIFDNLNNHSTFIGYLLFPLKVK